jgi:hypothetical protein
VNESIAKLWPELRFLPPDRQEEEIIKKYEGLVLRYPEVAEATMSWATERDLSPADCFFISEVMRMVFLIGYTHGGRGIDL